MELHFSPKSLDEVDDITRVVARDIHSQYTIGYKPTDHSKNGGYRTIEVTSAGTRPSQTDRSHSKWVLRGRGGPLSVRHPDV